MDKVTTYVRPNAKMSAEWSEVPEETKDIFEKSGILKTEREGLVGVDAQRDSELVYHGVKKEITEQGAIYTGLESAIHGSYEQMIRDHFMKFVPSTNHKSAALHGVVRLGGSFVYVSLGVCVETPLQSYFRLNVPSAGQFEYALITVDKGAYLHFIEGYSAPKYNVTDLHAGRVELLAGERATIHYSIIENRSKDMYNPNAKRVRVEEDGKVEWISGSLGFRVGYLYLISVLAGDRAHSELSGVTFTGAGQNFDTGCKIVHTGRSTSSYVNTRSISKSGGTSTFRSVVVVQVSVENVKNSVSCQSLVFDAESRSDTIPAIEVKTNKVDVGREAKIGRIPDDAVFYLTSRGVSEGDVRALTVSGFTDNVGKELPLEYAVEVNDLIRLEMKGAIG